ncbi:sulfoxide reductase heme-binding subunit YedZ [Curvibacter sp. RS43]|uniref:sulfite oxidase heme-binding subunit YedZ n=1 Tax=Curvibacter microcysteis TaxID=3026419 RepID=UPI002361813A|nr:protein-methionine-sulfoxide reductase heme-binding subunit MsrQ [Curvibacter sp. RS43]MDD0810316.1 sulfoxide reductase heme-binding subunit YedZ [Curvibacter sp. RS43]
MSRPAAPAGAHPTGGAWAGVKAGLQRALLSPWRPWVQTLLCLLPLAWLVAGVVFDTLGANPAEALIRSTGDWTLRALCLTLAVTPLRVSLGLPALARVRRLLGLAAYFYAGLHLLCYAAFDMGLDLADIAMDIGKRPFILVGFSAWLLMLPLALTSFNRAIKAVGGKNWQRLHRLVYGVVLLGLLHFFWMRAGKHNFTEVAVYGLVIAALLGWRLQRAVRRP